MKQSIADWFTRMFLPSINTKGELLVTTTETVEKAPHPLPPDLVQTYVTRFSEARPVVKKARTAVLAGVRMEMHLPNCDAYVCFLRNAAFKLESNGVVHLPSTMKTYTLSRFYTDEKGFYQDPEEQHSSLENVFFTFFEKHRALLDRRQTEVLDMRQINNITACNKAVADIDTYLNSLGV